MGSEMCIRDSIDTVGTLDDLPQHLPDADVIVLACPLNQATSNLASTAFFDHIKPGAILINIGRGGLIDDQALIRALDNGQLSLAILDVFSQEPLPADDVFWTHPGIRVTPHTSFNGDGVHDRWDTLFLENLQRFVEGQPLAQLVAPNDVV